MELSKQSRAHFADLIFQKCSERFNFLKHFQVEIELSPQSHAHIADLIFQSAPSRPSPVSFLRCLCETSPRYSLVHILSTAFSGSSRAPAETTLPEKHRVSRPSVFKPEFTHSRSLTLLDYTCMMMRWS